MSGSVVFRWLLPAALATALASPVQTASPMGGGHGMGGGGVTVWVAWEEEGLVGEEWRCAVARRCHPVPLATTEQITLLSTRIQRLETITLADPPIGVITRLIARTNLVIAKA